MEEIEDVQAAKLRGGEDPRLEGRPGREAAPPPPPTQVALVDELCALARADASAAVTGARITAAREEGRTHRSRLLRLG
jgi:hypothetical protein